MLSIQFNDYVISIFDDNGFEMCGFSNLRKKKTNLIIVVLVYYNNFIIYTYYIRNRSTTWFDLLRSLKVSMANKKNPIQIIGIVKTMRARFIFLPP